MPQQMTGRLVAASAVLFGCATLSLAALNPDGPRVAIVAAAANTQTPGTHPRFTDPRDQLVASGLFSAVDIISTTRFVNPSTPSLATLQQYDAVLHWTNDSNDNSVALGNVFADYVDAGGGVVVAVFANTSPNNNRFLAGRWLDGGYEIIPSNGGHLEGPASPPDSGVNGGFVNMQSPLEDHPIFEGVEDVRLNWVRSSTGLLFGAHRPVSTLLEPDTRKLALWEDGKTAVAISNLNPKRIDLGIHPVSELINAGYYDLESDADRMIANALFYSATVPEPSLALGVSVLAMGLVRRRGR